MGVPHRTDGHLDRRTFLRAGTAVAASAGVMLSAPGASAAAGSASRHRPRPTPEPIPGGLDLSGFGLLPPYDFIHTFLPGPESVTLPFTGGQLMGLDVEPSTITDRRGATALAYHVGEGEGSDGETYGFETDVRVMRGRYRVGDQVHRGTFAFL